MLEWIINNLSTLMWALAAGVFIYFLMRIMRLMGRYYKKCIAIPRDRFEGRPPRKQRVEFAAFSPRKITKGSTFILDVWEYLPKYYELISRYPKELGRDALIGRKIGVSIEICQYLDQVSGSEAGF